MVAAQSHALVTLRHALKTRTQPMHDWLDAAIGGAPDEAGYTAFLTVQHAARAPIERWTAAHMAFDLQPPRVTRLIEADLNELGAVPPPNESFSVPPHADPLGLAWALGGSALGNKLVLAQRRRAGHASANRFLGDGSAAAYFHRILPHLQREVSPQEADAAVAAAEAVFRTFLAAASRVGLQAAA